jgi:hypothetical protein
MIQILCSLLSLSEASRCLHLAHWQDWELLGLERRRLRQVDPTFQVLSRKVQPERCNQPLQQ